MQEIDARPEIAITLNKLQNLKVFRSLIRNYI